MRKVYILLLLACSFAFAQAQELIVSEICPSNATGYEEEAEFPDWIELQNISGQTINLSSYSIADKSTITTPVALPDFEIANNELVLLVSKDQKVSQGVVQYSTLIDKGDTWKYLVPTSEPTANWRTTTFNDAAWLEGPSGFGYGDNDDETDLGAISSVFVRTTFSIPDVSKVKELFLHMDYDDSFVAFINGQEVARMGLTDALPAFDVLEGGNEANFSQSLPIPEFALANFTDYLVTGENTIAIQVHNGSANSSDLSCIPILTIGLNEENVSLPPVSSLTHLSSNAAGFSVPFNISKNSETIYVFKNGVIIDSLAYKDVPVDISVGRYNQVLSELFFFQDDTPNQPNSITRYTPEALSKPIFNKPAGEYSSRFYVNIFTSEKNVTIKYTLDGSDPDENSSTYIDSIQVRLNTNLKSRVYKQGYLPGPVRTASYIFHQNTLNLPIISITMKDDDLYDYNTGIYELGPNAELQQPNFGANFWQDWERPTHIDFIEADGTLGFSYDAGIKIAGNWSRAQPQKPFKFYARSQYGSKSFNYQIFKDKPIYEFQAFVIRNGGNDFNTGFFRDGLSSTLARNMHVCRSAYRPCIAYVNGEYFGVYNLREKINKDYVASNFNIPIDSLALLNNNGIGDEGLVWGDASSYYDLVTFLENNDLSNQANYEHVASVFDVQNVMEYFFVELYAVNEDWPANNRKYFRDLREGGKWQFILWDLDFGFGIWDDSKVTRNMLEYALEPNSSEWSNSPWSTLLLRKLTENDEFNNQFLNVVADRLNTNYSADSIHFLIDSLSNNFVSETYNHANRWYGDEGYYESNWEGMKYFASQREGYMRPNFENHFNTGGSYTLTITSSDSKAGKVHLNSIDVTTFPWSGDYFDNNTIYLTAQPAPGYAFDHWEGASMSTNPYIELTRSTTTSVKAVFVATPSTKPNVFFTELHYNPMDSLSGGNWVEVYNANSSTLDLSGYILQNEFSYNTYVIPNGVQVAGQSYYVFCTDVTTFEKAHSVNPLKYSGNVSFGFANGNGVLKLLSPNGFLIDKIEYNDKRPWPQKADGYGYSLELINLLADRTNPNNWRPISKLGSPTKASNAIIQDVNRTSVVINEINYKSHELSDAGDWIELYNASSSSIDISGWVVKDKGESNLFVIPDGTFIDANGFIVLAESPVKFATIYPTVSFINSNIGLSSYSDMVRLYDQYEYFVDSISYTYLPPWPIDVNGTAYTLSLQNPTSNNLFPTNWASSKQALGTPGAPNLDEFPDSIEDLGLQVLVFPNPATNKISVEVEGEAKIELINELGQLVMTSSLKELNVAILPRGVYTIVISLADQVTSQLVVLK